MGDIRYGFRLLRKSPGFTAVAIATLGARHRRQHRDLLHRRRPAHPRAALRRRRPHRHGVGRRAARPGSRATRRRPATITDWTRLNRSFAGIAATRGVTANLTGGGVPEQVVGRRGDAEFLRRPRREPGRRPGVHRGRRPIERQVVVISYGLWQRRFGGDRAAIGRTMLMNGNRYEIIGVMPRDFVFRNREVDYWMPIAFSPAAAASRNVALPERRRHGWRPASSLAAASDDMRRVDDDAAAGVSGAEHGIATSVRGADRGGAARQHARRSCWC